MNKVKHRSGRIESNTALLEEGQYVEAVIDLIKKWGGGVTFVEIKNMLSPYIEVSGDMAICLTDHPNLVLWAGMSDQFFDIISKALRSGEIAFSSTQVLVYMVDGEMPSMPIAKSIRDYKEPHWVPVQLHPKED